MAGFDTFGEQTARRTISGAARILLALKLDGPLLVGLGLVAAYGLVILYSASGQDWSTIVRALLRLGLGTVAMCALAQVNPRILRAGGAADLRARHPAADRRRRHRLHRQGRAALARPRLHPLPAVRDHEARGADAVRLVAARARAAAEPAGPARWSAR